MVPYVRLLYPNRVIQFQQESVMNVIYYSYCYVFILIVMYLFLLLCIYSYCYVLFLLLFLLLLCTIIIVMYVLFCTFCFHIPTGTLWLS